MISNSFGNQLADFVFGKVSLTPPATYYIGIATSAVDRTKTGSNFPETTYGGYARVVFTNNKTNFGNASADVNGTTVLNATEIRFPTLASGTMTTNQLVILDALNGGNIVGYGNIAVNKDYVAGDRPVFEVGTVQFKFL
jgi:hypothetical protein